MRKLRRLCLARLKFLHRKTIANTSNSQNPFSMLGIVVQTSLANAGPLLLSVCEFQQSRVNRALTWASARAPWCIAVTVQRGLPLPSSSLFSLPHWEGKTTLGSLDQPQLQATAPSVQRQGIKKNKFKNKN